jgi:hypothetical protein
MVEARLETAADLRQTGGGVGSAPWGWQDADNWGAIASSVEVLGDGGLRIKASGPSPFGSTVASAFYRSYEGGTKTTSYIDPVSADGQGGVGVMITPGVLSGQRSFSGAQAWLHPRYDVTKPKYVRTWQCVLCRVVPRSGGFLGFFGKSGGLVTLAHATARADNEVAGWVTFEFLDTAGLPFLFTPGGVLGGSLGQYVLFCHGYDARGQPATNIGWGDDAANTTFAAGGAWAGITFDAVAAYLASPTNFVMDKNGSIGGPVHLPAMQLLSRSFSTTPVTISFKTGRNSILASQALDNPFGVGANVLDNPSYEVDAAGTAVLGPTTISRDATHVHSGSWAMKVVTTGAAGNQGMFTHRRDGSAFPVAAGRSYVYSAWVYADASSVGKSWSVAVDWYDVTPTYLSTSGGSVVALAAGWNLLTVTGTAPATAISGVAYVVETASIAQTVWVDDVWFSAGAWWYTKLTPTGNAAAAPDGTTTATSLVPTAVSGDHIVEQSDPITVGEYTAMSGFFKANGYTALTLKVDGVTGNYTAAFDLTGGGAVTQLANFGSGYAILGAAIAPVPGAAGWYWCQVWGSTGTDASLEPTIVVYDTIAHATAQAAWTGDGTSGIYAWGIQFERNGASPVPPSPYQPTTTVAIAGRRLDLGVVPTVPPELELGAVTPSGTSVVGQVALAPSGGFVTFVDGEATSYAPTTPASGPPPLGYTDLGLATQRAYQVQATLQASADGARSPILYSIGARAIVAVDLGDVAEVVTWQEHFDPLSHVSEIGECVIRAIHDGERDFRDKITTLLSQNAPGRFSFRVYMGDRLLPKSQWLRLNDFSVDDTDPRGPDVGITTVCPLALLKQALPKLTADTSGIPVSDVSNPGGWTASSGQTIGTGTVAGAQQIADVDALANTGAPDDTGFIESVVNPTNAQYTVALSPMSTPQQLVGILIQVRAAVAAAGTSCLLKLELMEGAVVRATLNPTGAVTVNVADTGQGSYTPYQYQLTATEAGNIVSWSGLKIRFSATGTGGVKVRVGWARLVVLGLRAQLQYPSSATPAATVQGVMDDLIANQIGMDPRYRPMAPYKNTSPALPVSKSIATDPSGVTNLSRAKQELDWLAFVAGYVFTSFQGRIACVPLYRVTPGLDPITGSVTARFDALPGPAAVAIPREEIIPLATAPGWRQRVGVYNVPWGWNGNVYAGEAQVTNGATLLSFPPALVDPEQRAPAGVSQWISGDGLARGLATRHAQTFALGEPEWRFRMTYAYPEWQLGDVVTIGVDQFIAYDPIAGRALAGYLSATGVLCGKWDAEGHEWSIWIQGLSQLAPLPTAGTLTPTRYGTWRSSFADLLPEKNTGTWAVGPGYVYPNVVGVTTKFYANVVVPVGATIVSTSIPDYMDWPVDSWVATLNRIDASGAVTIIATQSRVGGGGFGAAVTTPLAVPEVVGASAYMIEITLLSSVAAANARFYYYDVNYKF